MTDKHRDAMLEMQVLMQAINQIAVKYGLENDFVSCLAVGFIDKESGYVDEDGEERVNMNLLSSFSASDEDELDDLLSYCVESYRVEKEEEEKEDKSTIDYWIKLTGGNPDLN